MTIEPSASCSRMPFAAMSPVIPAPTMRYVVDVISISSVSNRARRPRVSRSFYLRAGALRAGKRGRPLGHLAVAVGDPALVVRRPADGHRAVADVDVRVVVLALGGLGELHDEADRLAKRVELELPHERVVLLLPVVHRDTIPHGGTRTRRSDVQDSEE